MRINLMGRRKLRSLREIYKQTEAIPEKPSIDLQEENLISNLLTDMECPTLSPSPHTPPLVPASRSPSLDPCSSETSSFFNSRSPSTENKIFEAHHNIEEEVSSIATENGLVLYDEAPYVLGQWVHGEISDLRILKSILRNLEQKKEKSEFFEAAVDAWSHQFLVPSPGEEFYMNPTSLLFWLLLLVLLVLCFRIKKRVSKPSSLSI